MFMFRIDLYQKVIESSKEESYEHRDDVVKEIAKALVLLKQKQLKHAIKDSEIQAGISLLDKRLRDENCKE